MEIRCVHEGLRGTRFDVGWIWPAARVKPRLPDPTVVGGGCCLLRPCTQARCFKQVSYQEAAVLNGRYCKEVRRNEGWVLHCGSAWGRAGTPVWCLVEMVTMLSRPANSVRMSDWRVVSVRTRDRTRGRAGWNPAGGACGVDGYCSVRRLPGQVWLRRGCHPALRRAVCV